MSYRFMDGTPVNPPPAMEKVEEGGRPLKKLEDMTAANTWDSYRDARIPSAANGGPEGFFLERLEEAWLCGAFAMLAMAERLRKETPERGHALLDRLRGEVEKRVQELDGTGQVPS